ncbi:MAG: hypothetical protein KDB14_34825 [Planctomycetales bacterium]|nr:hypothetical protein [Planctomycetales bacterium]
MNEHLPTPQLARTVERNLFGALLGAVAASLLARLVLLVMHVPGIPLAALLIIGASAGAFVAQHRARESDPVTTRWLAWNAMLRRLSLKVMLWMVAAAAVIGVLTVLTASYEVLGRVAGTVVATAIAAGLLWPLSVMVDQPEKQSAGLLGMFNVVLVYIMVVPLIWDLDPHGRQMLFSSLVFGLTAPFGMFYLTLTRQPAGWIASRVGVATYVTVVAVWLLATWQSNKWDVITSNWFATGWWCAAYGNLSAACLCGLPRLSWNWRWIGVLFSLLAWMLGMAAQWSDKAFDDDTLTLLTSVCVVVAYASLALVAPLRAGQQWLRVGAILASIVSAACFDVEKLTSSMPGFHTAGRVSAAAAILASCGALALVILARLNGVGARTVKSPAEPAFPRLAKSQGETRHIRMTCPDCETPLAGPIGTLECPHCRLRITVSIQPPQVPE